MYNFLCFILFLFIFLFLSIILIVYSTGQLPTLRRYNLIQKLPGPKGILLLGNSLELKSVPIEDLLHWIKGRFKEYDRLMRLWVLGVSNVYVKEPDDIQALCNSLQHINKGLEYFMLRPWLDEGLLTSSGEKWHSRRKLLTPAFHFKILEDNLIILNRCSKILSEKLQQTEEREVDIESYITLCTLDVIMGTAMGINLDVQKEGGQVYVKQLQKLSLLFTERMMRPHLFLNFTFKLSKTGREFKKAITYLHNFSYKVIDERKKEFSKSCNESSKVRRAFLDLLIEYAFKNPGSFSDKDIREEVDTFMFEGHDTTSSALVFTFFMLATHPDVQEKVHEELFNIFGKTDRDVTSNDLNRMSYLEKVIKETLRLYPSVPIVTRLLDKDLILNDGVVIPAKTNIIPAIFLVHRNEKYWSHPDVFDPERFSDEENLHRHPYAYIPFSAGSRNCIGQKFAMMELKTVVSTVLRKLRIEPITTEKDFKTTFFLVMRTSKPIKCKFILK